MIFHVQYAMFNVSIFYVLTQFVSLIGLAWLYRVLQLNSIISYGDLNK